MQEVFAAGVADILADGRVDIGEPDEAGGEGIGVPERMAPVNAMIDLASPAMREALLVAFFDRLQRPNRG